MQLIGRGFRAGSGYRYGFNGKEKDNEVKGEGNQQDYGMRIYDTRLGRFLSEDPLKDEYPELTPYQFAGNTPIQATDLDGLEPAYHYEDEKGRIILMPAGDNLARRVPPEHLKYLPQARKDDGSILRMVSTVLDFIPVVGSIKGAIEGLAGYNMEGDQLSSSDRTLGLVPYVGKGKKIAKIVKASDKVDDATKTAKKVFKSEKVAGGTEKAIVKNKNSNDAVGDFVLYDLYSEPGNKGKYLKIGKADAERLTASGDIVRMKASERAARKAGYPNATANVRKRLGRTTTKDARSAEAAEVRSERRNGNELPLNKERDKNYQ